MENPHQLLPLPLNDQKVTVWCGFTANFILNPYFFEEEQNNQLKTTTVNGSRYQEMLESFALPALHERLTDEEFGRLIFQQDGAPPHIYRPVKNRLQQSFGDRVISRHFPESWPPRSPDLNPLDFWLWGHLQSRVFARNPSNVDELKLAIRDEISVITGEQLSNAVNDFTKRVNAVVESEGRHFEHLL